MSGEKSKMHEHLNEKDDKTPMVELWEKLGNIPIDENECVEEPFEHFSAGTDRYEIWHWFEDRFNIEVASLLYPVSKMNG